MWRECHTQVNCSYALSHYLRKGNACRRVQVQFRSSTLTQRIGLFSFKHSSSVSHASPKESTQCNFPFYSIVYLFEVTTPLQLLKVHKTKRYPQNVRESVNQLVEQRHVIIDGKKIKLHFHLGGDYKVSKQTEFDNSL